MNHDCYSDAYLREILTSVRTIAVVGASPRRERPSYGVMACLQRHGYRAIPVNPNAAGASILGETCYAALDDVPEPVEMVDVFRRSEMAGAAVDAAIAVGAKFVWMQLGVRDDAGRRPRRSPRDQGGNEPLPRRSRSRACGCRRVDPGARYRRRSYFCCGRTLTRLAALGTLSRIAGEGGPGPQGWVGEGLSQE